MANLIPMAGLGTRFSKEGYSLPKPLIPVDGTPMIIKVIRGLPVSDKWIFIVRQEHVAEYSIDKIIKKELSDAIIVPVSQPTEGQACTCMLAEPYLDKDEPLLISACDNSSIYNAKQYKQLCFDNESFVWTFTRTERQKKNPSSFGWYKINSSNEIIQVSVKKQISKDPYNDHAIVGTFFFKKSKYFFDATRQMIRQNYRTNNEFYIDSIPLFTHKKSVIFDVDKFICWGTPEELSEHHQKPKHLYNQ